MNVKLETMLQAALVGGFAGDWQESSPQLEPIAALSQTARAEHCIQSNQPFIGEVQE